MPAPTSLPPCTPLIVPSTAQYLIANLGMSQNFGAIDYDKLQFPTTLRIDWVRVYQDPNNINIGCDPPDFPTAEYIKASVRPLSRYAARDC